MSGAAVVLVHVVKLQVHRTKKKQHEDSWQLAGKKKKAIIYPTTSTRLKCMCIVQDMLCHIALS